MGYVNQERATENDDVLNSTIEQIANAAQEDRKYVNETIEINKQLVEQMVAAMVEQQKQMPAS